MVPRLVWAAILESLDWISTDHRGCTGGGPSATVTKSRVRLGRSIIGPRVGSWLGHHA